MHIYLFTYLPIHLSMYIYIYAIYIYIHMYIYIHIWYIYIYTYMIYIYMYIYIYIWYAETLLLVQSFGHAFTREVYRMLRHQLREAQFSSTNVDSNVALLGRGMRWHFSSKSASKRICEVENGGKYGPLKWMILLYKHMENMDDQLWKLWKTRGWHDLTCTIFRCENLPERNCFWISNKRLKCGYIFFSDLETLKKISP